MRWSITIQRLAVVVDAIGEHVDGQCVPVPPNADELHVFDGYGCAT
jgi:hypothetical protein